MPRHYYSCSRGAESSFVGTELSRSGRLGGVWRLVRKIIGAHENGPCLMRAERGRSVFCQQQPCTARSGFSTARAIIAATAFINAARRNTECQPPVAVASTLAN